MLTLVNVMRITDSVSTDGDERRLSQDHGCWLAALTLRQPIGRYGHDCTGEDNADAHLHRPDRS